MITREDIGRVTSQLLRLGNKYRRLDSRAIDFGTGDLLYPSEIHVIEAIGKGHGATVNEICRLFGVTKGAISQIVHKLSGKGLVGRTRNPDYHKEIILSLTTRGRKAFEGHERLHGTMDGELYMYLSDVKKENLQSFEEFIARIEILVDRYIEYGKEK